MFALARARPAHPKDVGFSEGALSCEECWRTRVAGVGLTLATGNGRADVAKVKEYKRNAEKLKEGDDTLGALDNYEKFVELSLKCIGYKRGAESPFVSAGDLDSMGDLYATAGSAEKSHESYQQAIRLLENADTEIPLNVLEAMSWGAAKGIRDAKKESIKAKLAKLPPPPPPP